MTHARLTGWVINHAGETISVGEYGRIERMVESLQWYINNMLTVSLYLESDNL